MIDIASLTADQWLSATGWNLRTLRQYPDKALRVLAEQSARAERLEVALVAERARADQAEQRITDALAAVRRSQRSEWVRELQSSIQRLSFADIIEAERILSAAPTAEQ